jgi:hypothetical protein
MADRAPAVLALTLPELPPGGAAIPPAGCVHVIGAGRWTSGGRCATAPRGVLILESGALAVVSEDGATVGAFLSSGELVDLAGALLLLAAEVRQREALAAAPAAGAA